MASPQNIEPQQGKPSTTFTVTYDRDGHVTFTPPRRIELSITPELADLFAQAADVNVSSATPLSFTSLLVAMLTGDHPIAILLRDEFSRQGAATAEMIASRRSLSLTAQQQAAAPPSELAASMSARRVIEEALTIADALPSPLLDVRHLVAAFPILPNWHVEDFKDLGIDRLAWCRALGAHLASAFRSEKKYWREYADRASSVPLTSFSADVYTERDLLGIDRTVDALALLIASTRTDTPLSIGVFGPWGSGKSFFMRHLRHRIYGLAARAQDRTKDWIGKREIGEATDDDVPLYYGQVAQVEFNAWHYNEGNLVASLVDHLFRNLHVLPGKDDDLERRRADVMTKIKAAEEETEVATAAVAETKARIENAQSDVKRTIDEISSVKEDIDSKAKELSDAATQADRVREEFDGRIDDYGAAAGAAISAAYQPVRESKAVEEARRAVGVFAAQYQDWKKFLGGLFSTRAVLVIALCLTAPLAAWMADWLNQAWAALTGATAAAAASLAQGFRLVREWRKDFEEKLKNLQEEEARWRAELEKEQARRKEAALADWNRKLAALTGEIGKQRTELAAREAVHMTAVQALSDLTAELDRKVQTRASAENELVALQDELRKLSSAFRLDEFIKDRSGADDYRKELSFLALVRRDFERLSDLIAAANEEWCSPKSTAPAPLLNRIVLYIDDLDRCDVDTVIRVLEAVHLLLAFKLFVCVVAVDPRWIEQCLREKHAHLFGGEDEGHATVGDYLEKIFQIPIWMQPIETTQRAELVKSLLGSTAAPEPRRTGQDRGARAVPNPPPPPDRAQAAASASDGFQAAVKKARETPDPLRITPEEAKFVDQVAELLSNKPRALKRFVNTYRLLKASLSAVDHQTFISDDASSSYRICMSQLALFTGQPRLAPALVQQLAKLEDMDISFQEWCDMLPDKERRQLAEALALVPDRQELRLRRYREWLPDTTRYLFHRDDLLPSGSYRSPAPPPEQAAAATAAAAPNEKSMEAEA